MSESARADYQQPDHQQYQMGTAVVAADLMLTQCAPNARLQPEELKIAAHQFQPAVGRELLMTELDRKLSLDHPPQPRYIQPHLLGPPAPRRVALPCTPNDAPEALFVRSIFRLCRNFFRFRVNSWARDNSHAAAGIIAKAESVDTARGIHDHSPVSRMRLSPRYIIGCRWCSMSAADVCLRAAHASVALEDTSLPSDRRS